METILNYSVPVTSKYEENNPDELLIQGVAINATTTTNGHTFLVDELQASAHTLRDRPILKNHENDVDSIVGRTTKDIEFDNTNSNIPFKGVIKDKSMIQKIRNGLITTVSVGANVNDLEETEEGNYILRGINFRELSLVAVPADEGATFTKAIAEMATKKTKPKEEEPMNEENTKLAQELTEAKAELEKLKMEKLQGKILEYKKLAAEKKVSVIALDNVDEKTLTVLIETLKQVKAEDEEQEEEPATEPEEEQDATKGNVATTTNDAPQEEMFGIESKGLKHSIYAKQPFLQKFGAFKR